MENVYQLLAGMTEENTFIFLNIDFERGYFSMSADELEPTAWTEDGKNVYYIERAEDLDAETKLYLLEHFDVAPSELVDALQSAEPFEESLDCSLTPKHLYHMNGLDIDDETEFYLESGGCGQLRDLKIKKHFLDPEALQYLMKAWKTYHLKDVIPTEISYTIDKIIDAYNVVDIEKREENFIRTESLKCLGFIEE